jgi:FAD:protein FMN transferase
MRPPRRPQPRPSPAAVAVTELTFRVMASDAHVILVDPAQGAERHARTRLEELEHRWSRFLPGSDISRLNTSPDAFLIVSADTIGLLATMKHAWLSTAGRYDPTLLGAINAAGYSASIDGSGKASCTAGSAKRGCTIADVQIDAEASAVVVPAGVGLDPGAIGKGLAADMVVTELLAGGTGGALVSVGGDLAASGAPPTAEGWYVAVEHPLDSSRELLRLVLGAGGVATSSTLSRAWVQDGDRRHHVIDPDTQTCATTDLAAVSVVARAGWEAEAHATAALLSGADRALEYLADHQLDGVATTLDGTTSMSPALECAGAFEGSAA